MVFHGKVVTFHQDHDPKKWLGSRHPRHGCWAGRRWRRGHGGWAATKHGCNDLPVLRGYQPSIEMAGWLVVWHITFSFSIFFHVLDNSHGFPTWFPSAGVLELQFLPAKKTSPSPRRQEGSGRHRHGGVPHGLLVAFSFDDLGEKMLIAKLMMKRHLETSSTDNQPMVY